MRRFITILLIILIVLALVLGVSWFISRKTAQKNGLPAPTFREFLRFGTKGGTNGTGDGELSSVFTPSTTPGSTSQTGGNTPPDVLVSQFTGGIYTPPLGGPITPGSGTSTTTGGGTTTTTGGTTPSGPVNTGGTAPTAPLCSDADLSIQFTAAELARLQVLQQKFYSLAETIHNDANVAAEIANYDAFRGKTNKIRELYTYCQQKAPALTAEVMKKRVPTPFWHDNAKDTIAFITGWGGPMQINGEIALDNLPLGKYIMEHVLRLNLW